jgi:DNA-binding response OmpR family regulator
MLVTKHVKSQPDFPRLLVWQFMMKQDASSSARPVIALFNASDDTVAMVQHILDASGFGRLVGCRFSALKRRVNHFADFVATHEPDVLIFDISPPYKENWDFFKTLRESKAMEGRGLVLTTTNRRQLDKTAGEKSGALEVVGKPHDLNQIKVAIHAALKRARAVKRSARH